jgi:diaminopimelate epimerase
MRLEITKMQGLGNDFVVLDATRTARGLLDDRVQVSTRGGGLGISWRGEGTPVLMTGPAATVFEGEIEL